LREEVFDHFSFVPMLGGKESWGISNAEQGIKNEEE
jgi:hypothetical protein